MTFSVITLHNSTSQNWTTRSTEALREFVEQEIVHAAPAGFGKIARIDSAGGGDYQQNEYIVIYYPTSMGASTVPSKRKQKAREDKLFQDGWFELSDDMWLEPGEKPKKVRLVADANFPYQLVEVLREQKIEVKTAQELGLHRLADKELLRRVLELGYALITMDGDWGFRTMPISVPGMPISGSGMMAIMIPG